MSMSLVETHIGMDNTNIKVSGCRQGGTQPPVAKGNHADVTNEPPVCPAKRLGGPKTAAGKLRSRANSTKFGLRTTQPMICRRDRCRMFPICAAPSLLSAEWSRQKYGDPCLLEADLSSKWRAAELRKDHFDPDKPDERQLLEDLIATANLKERAQRALALKCNGDLLRAQLIYIGGLEDPDEVEIKRLYRYYIRHRNRWNKALERALPTIRGIQAIQRYKERIMATREM